MIEDIQHNPFVCIGQLIKTQLIYHGKITLLARENINKDGCIRVEC